MSKIIQIDELYDNYCEMNFGYIGIDLETKKIKYYSHYNLNQEYSPKNLYEFDPNNLEVDNKISWHMYHCNHKSSLAKKLPIELEKLVKGIINQHKQYNINNNYPIEYINKNLINLSIEYQSDFSLFGDLGFSATYTPIENTIGLAIDESKWKNLSNDEKCFIIHEVGHMKASSYRHDEVNNILIVKTGFYLSKVELEPINLENGDIFYRITSVPKRWENCNERALEEIINDLDCSLAFNSFNGNYPKLGKRLNDLCDKKLTYARYDIGIEEVYTCLQKIIDSRDLADELLEYVSDSIYGYDPEISEKKALQLIKRYYENK